MTTASVVVVVVAALLVVHVIVLVILRPQRGLLLLAALVPFDGLLLVVPGGAGLAGWKEALVLATLLATLVAPAAARRPAGERPPSWLAVVAAWTLLGLVHAAVVGGVLGAVGTQGRLLLPARAGDLVAVPVRRARPRPAGLGADGHRGVTVAIGFAQQVVGADRLHALGYEYNETIRFSGGLLRSFSTFTQPFSFALFVALVLLVCVPVALADPRRRRNRWFLIVAPLLALGMTTSVVRGAILGLALGAVVLAAWRYRVLVHALGPALAAAIFLPRDLTTAFLSSSSLGAAVLGLVGDHRPSALGAPRQRSRGHRRRGRAGARGGCRPWTTCSSSTVRCTCPTTST